MIPVRENSEVVIIYPDVSIYIYISYIYISYIEISDDDFPILNHFLKPSLATIYLTTLRPPLGAPTNTRPLPT